QEVDEHGADRVDHDRRGEHELQAREQATVPLAPGEQPRQLLADHAASMTAAADGAWGEDCGPRSGVPSGGMRRQSTLGAVPLGDGRTSFRVWAPEVRTVAVELGGADRPLE